MIHGEKKNVVGILVDVIDYEGAVDYVLRAAREKRSASVCALAVHAVMNAALDSEHKHRMNSMSLALPDGQPVRWALNLLYRAPLTERCYGPTLTLLLCERAAKEGLPIFFYGTSPEILDKMRVNLLKSYPGLIIAGMEPGKYRRMTPEEKAGLAERIRNSGAAMVFVGLGCPKQEVFVYEFADLLPMPALAVGAAFPFIAGDVRQAPKWIQDIGMEWFFRLCMEPRRLWRRYVLFNPAYVFMLTLQLLGLRSYETAGATPTELLYG